ncbi:hypothetical protein [Tepidibacter formicigenes]|jgi:hypothetical protein|uniref:Uncharacterized protein n=1 Tax=Tepidibacter formicigenes DSM 15518 TaxID=1123349 RepID=A0A1M6SLX3_9FIRM|nr:hypothetical protein [Tepidibacter formicigenes]SHK45751.1 hypothetical protein SAMN02744037_02373 [Tepidibacter formicigenes DSM 15518]
MNKIGLSHEDIHNILKNAISPEKTIDSDAIRDVIATAIIKNNEKILEDIKRIYPTK